MCTANAQSWRKRARGSLKSKTATELFKELVARVGCVNASGRVCSLIACACARVAPSRRPPLVRALGAIPACVRLCLERHTAQACAVRTESGGERAKYTHTHTHERRFVRSHIYTNTAPCAIRAALCCCCSLSCRTISPCRRVCCSEVCASKLTGFEALLAAPRRRKNGRGASKFA